ncbi:MAG: hypothetical protein ACRDWI_06470 [Jiangellaceae bacterium]
MTRVTFTCTARGTHQPRLLGEAQVTDDGVVTFESRGPSDVRDGRGRPRRSNMFARVDAETGQAYSVYRMLCSSCPTHVEWQLERAEAIARRAAEDARLAGRRVAPFDVANMS